MSAEDVVLGIIDNAAAVAAAKSQQADSLARQAMSSGFLTGGGSGAFNAPQHHIDEYPVPSVPHSERQFEQQQTQIFDQGVFDSVTSKVLGDLQSAANQFFSSFLSPNDYGMGSWASQVFSGGSGLPPHVEGQIWERARSRALTSAHQAGEQVLATFAARGFPLPPGAAQHQISMSNQQALEETSAAGREASIKNAELHLESTKTAVDAVGKLLDYRAKVIQAAANYVRGLAAAPQAGAQVAKTSSQAVDSATNEKARNKASLISAAASYYNARVNAANVAASAQMHASGLNLQMHEIGSRALTTSIQNRTQALVSLATSLGNQAASALNAVNANAAIQVHGSADGSA